MITAADFVARLEQDGRKVERRGDSWMAQCPGPGHEDDKPSLSIKDGHTSTIIRCFADCPSADVVGVYGWTLKDLSPNGTNGASGRPRRPKAAPSAFTITEEQVKGYVAALGPEALERARELRGWSPEALRLLGVGYAAGRFTIPCRDADMRLVNLLRYSPDGGPTKMRGETDAPRVLFPPPEIVAGRILYVVEGEPDAIAMATIGLPAVAIPGASGWKPEYAARIARSREAVVIIPDCDPAGRKVADAAITDLKATGVEVGQIDLTPFSDGVKGYDVSDLLQGVLADGASLALVRDLLKRSVEPVVEPAAPTAASTPPPAAGPVVEGPPVDGAELLAELRAFVARYMVLPSDGVADLLALWVLHSWVFESAFATPYLRVTSAAPDSGKTQLLEILAALCRHGWHAVNPSSAVLYRKVHRDKPTLLLDEMDNFPLDDRKDALAVLNAGYKRGAMINRCTESGELQEFSAYCPKAYAGLDDKALVSTLLSRSITVRLKPRAPGEKLQRWRPGRTELLAVPLRERCELWAAQNMDELGAADPAPPAGLINRALEIWEPLLILAAQAGGDWPERALAAAKGLGSGGDKHDGRSDQEQLLRDIQAAFGDERAIPTESLLTSLNKQEESPWGGRRRGEGLDARGLSRMLRPFGIRPGTIRVGERTPKGYYWHQFDDAFARHLPGPPHPQHPPQPAFQSEKNVADSVADRPDVADSVRMWRMMLRIGRRTHRALEPMLRMWRMWRTFRPARPPARPSPTRRAAGCPRRTRRRRSPRAGSTSTATRSPTRPRPSRTPRRTSRRRWPACAPTTPTSTTSSRRRRDHR